jgi:hypothetical protein
MKTFKASLHILIASFSILAFLGGWATLAHSRKPIQPAQFQAQALQPLPALDPIPSFNSASVDNNNNSGGLNSLITTRRSSGMSPMFMTRGS